MCKHQGRQSSLSISCFNVHHFLVLTAQTRSLGRALRLQSEMLTSTWMEDSRKLALTADCQAVCNEQESAHTPASSHALCPRQSVSPEGRKKTPQPPGSCQSSSSCLLAASCLIMLIKGQVQYSADDKFKSTPVPKTLISETPAL